MKLVNTYIQIFLTSISVILFSAGNAQVWSLQQCLDTASFKNKNLEISKNQILLSELKEKEAKSNLLPKITANADYKYFIHLPYQLMPLSTFNPLAPEGQFKEAQFGVPHNLNANIQITAPIFNPQLNGAIKSTETLIEINQLHYQKKEEQIYYEITGLYYNAQLLFHQLSFIDSNLINSNRLQKNAELLYEHQLAKETDVNKIKWQIAQLNTQRLSIADKYEQILSGLKFMIGIDQNENLQIDTDIKLNKTDDQNKGKITDIELIKTKSNLLNQELSTYKKSMYLPVINFIGMYGTNGLGYDKEPNPFLNFYPNSFAGIQISYPVFNGTVTKHKINQKNLELKNNELVLKITEEQNEIQILNASNQKETAIKSVETIQEQIKLAQTIYNQTITLLKQGNASLTEVILADNSLRESQQNYLNAIIEYYKAELELKKLNGSIGSKKP
jgi:outer membrane protein TolC